MKTRTALPAAALALLLAAPAFADGSSGQTEADGQPAAEAADTPPVRDRYERYNRFMFKINDKADRYVLAPVARGYRKATPPPVRTGVRNFFNNLRDVVSFGSNVLRLDIKRASEDFMRVSLNSTFGLAGLIDVAGAGGIPDNKNALGDTFASWGWKKSHYFVYPLLGPSTLRDSVGNTALMAYPVQNAVFHTAAGRYAASGLNAVSTRESYLDITDSLGDAALDPYIMMRDGYMQMRDKQIGIWPSENGDSGGEIDIDELVAPADGGAQPAVQASAAVPEHPAPAAEEIPALETPAETATLLEAKPQPETSSDAETASEAH